MLGLAPAANRGLPQVGPPRQVRDVSFLLSTQNRRTRARAVAVHVTRALAAGKRRRRAPVHARALCALGDRVAVGAVPRSRLRKGRREGFLERAATDRVALDDHRPEVLYRRGFPAHSESAFSIAQRGLTPRFRQRMRRVGRCALDDDDRTAVGQSTHSRAGHILCGGCCSQHGSQRSPDPAARVRSS